MTYEIKDYSYKKAKEILGWDPNVDLETLIKKVASEIQL